MRLAYLLLSPTLGMHQYTADLANRMVGDHEVHLVTTSGWPADRYDERVRVHATCATTGTGLSVESLRRRELVATRRALERISADLVHVTGPHLWNLPLIRGVRRRGVPVLHTLHDLDPHRGARYGRLLNGWNRLIAREADHLLVHGQIHCRRLIDQGVPAGRVSAWPLSHLFVSHAQERRLAAAPPSIRHEPFALFFGRVEAYKGVDILLAAFARLAREGNLGEWRLVIAGSGRLAAELSAELPPFVEWRDRFVPDDEAVDLFTRCGIVVLPYVEASQSALVAAAGYFSKPVIATRTGALPEYVTDGRTGLLVEPGDVTDLMGSLHRVMSDGAWARHLGSQGRLWYDELRITESRALRALYESLSQSSGKRRRMAA